MFIEYDDNMEYVDTVSSNKKWQLLHPGLCV